MRFDLRDVESEEGYHGHYNFARVYKTLRCSPAMAAAATARIGEAKADLIPRFVLTGTAGRQAAQLHYLTLGAVNFFSVGPGISLPLFTGGAYVRTSPYKPRGSGRP
jgi:hypothetical protein